MRKIIITLPDDQAKAIEQIRRKRRVPRSRVIQEAVASYLAEQEYSLKVRAYIEGYRKYPEGREAEAYVRMAAEVLEPEDWE